MLIDLGKQGHWELYSRPMPWRRRGGIWPGNFRSSLTAWMRCPRASGSSKVCRPRVSAWSCAKGPAHLPGCGRMPGQPHLLTGDLKDFGPAHEPAGGYLRCSCPDGGRLSRPSRAPTGMKRDLAGRLRPWRPNPLFVESDSTGTGACHPSSRSATERLHPRATDRRTRRRPGAGRPAYPR